MSLKRTAFIIVGNLLIAVSLGGLVMLTFGPPDAWLEAAADVAESVGIAAVAAPGSPGLSDSRSVAAAFVPALVAATREPKPTTSGSSPAEGAATGRLFAPALAITTPEPLLAPTPTALRHTATPVPFRPITKVIIPRIFLEAEVVPAKLVQKDGGLTWEVPAFKAGHAESTAGAGGLGNAVVLGHVASRDVGKIFKDLDKARVGDRVQAFSGGQQFDYQVVDVREVARTDVSVVQPTGTSSISLITCTGLWLPLIRDYAERLVVRAELISAIPVAAAQPAPSTQLSTTPTAARRTVLDERFADNRPNWPEDPQATAWFADGTYRLFARQPSQFVAIGAPIAQSLSDVVVTATFRKVGGPPGGGYGLIVRDQGPGPRDGINQGGRYYVLEAGDRGEVGMWRRDGDRWIELLPWTPSEAVRPGGAANELTVQAIGRRLTFLVNGKQVASQADAALADGATGIFVGGDFNEVVLERFVVEVPT